MEGKKIAFIVVAIATVGGIAYYLNKRNKQLVGALASPETRSEKIAKVKDYYEKETSAIAPTYTVSSDNDEYRGDSKPSQRVATGYKK